MSEQTRLPLVADDTLPDAPQTAMAVVERPEEPTRGALVDLRQGAMMMPVEAMQAALAEYSSRRKTFRDWLRLHLVEGVHYGYPPGCAPSRADEKQWKAKPSLYKAGADFVCDLMGLRPEYVADNEAWAQLGSQKEYFVMTCRLYSRSTGELLGEGRGVRKVGQKGGDANNAIKMAEKSAKVSAVLNIYGLSDLFTQDIEDEPQPPHDNPTPREDAPKVKPRSERSADVAVGEKVEQFLELWKSHRPLREQSKEKWASWVCEQAGRKFDVFKLSQWTAEALMQVAKALDAEDGYVE